MNTNFYNYIDESSEIDTNTYTQAKRKESRAKQVRQAKFNLLIIVTVLVVNITIVAGTLLTSAQESDAVTYDVQYISLEVQSGDSLWSIAQEYKSNPDINTKEAVDEIIALNQLSNDSINEGQYIIVAKYTTNYATNS